MAKLPDGTGIDLNCTPHILWHRDELYVIGNGWMVHVSDDTEAHTVLKRISEEGPCRLEREEQQR